MVGSCVGPSSMTTGAIPEVAGLMNFANKNLFGGTILTAFAFNWIMNWWVLTSLAAGTVPDHDILLATDTVSLVIFVVITYGFGFFSSLLFAFLLIGVIELPQLIGAHELQIPLPR